MSLKGNLRDFGVSDVLQLIGNQRKTGILSLKGVEEAGRFESFSRR